MFPDSDDSGDDDNVWEEAVKNVKPLMEADRARKEPGSVNQSGRRGVSPHAATAASPVPRAGRAGGNPPGLDRRTEERLRRGRMKVEGRLDLHGMRREEARAALERFLLAAHAQGRRCVLVITGKGRDSRPADGGHWLDPEPPGAIRRNVPLWLGSETLAPIILRHVPALPRDGGAGALYILLRRKR